MAMKYNSIINDYNIENDDAPSKFEDLVATGRTMKEIAMCFGVDYKTMCAAIVKWYGHPQAEFTYQRLRELALQGYIQTLGLLAQRGNPSAIAALNTFIHKLGGTEQTVKIQFVSNVKEETESDKSNDSEEDKNNGD